MNCDVCGKNEATVHVTEILDEKMMEFHLCEDCAREKGAVAKQSFSIADLMAGLADISAVLGAEEAVKKKCPACGLTYKDFKTIGRLGCGECYETFKENLVPLLKRIHGSIQHVGNVPSKRKREARPKIDLKELRERLTKAIQSEQYEEAAQIRDQIRLVESQSKTEEKKV